jgi:hypothetical protein
VMLVHGFDVPTDHADEFRMLVERVRPFLLRLDLRLRVVPTNIAELRLQNWHDSFLAQLSCAVYTIIRTSFDLG